MKKKIYKNITKSKNINFKKSEFINAILISANHAVWLLDGYFTFFKR